MRRRRCRAAATILVTGVVLAGCGSEEPPQPAGARPTDEPPAATSPDGEREPAPSGGYGY